MRKHLLREQPPPRTPHGEKDIAEVATVFVTSEAPAHPVENIFDGRTGPGATRWIADADGEQTLIIAFDSPQTIRQIRLDVEEPEVSRTQELSIAMSSDGGQTYRERMRQEFTFSPPGTTFEHEEWSLPDEGITHVRVVLKPDKGNRAGRATLTSLAIR